MKTNGMFVNVYEIKSYGNPNIVEPIAYYENGSNKDLLLVSAFYNDAKYSVQLQNFNAVERFKSETKTV